MTIHICKNCKNYDFIGCCFIPISKTFDLETGKYITLYDRLWPEKRIKNVCEHYKRKWWKFWVKEIK